MLYPPITQRHMGQSLNRRLTMCSRPEDSGETAKRFPPKAWSAAYSLICTRSVLKSRAFQHQLRLSTRCGQQESSIAAQHQSTESTFQVEHPEAFLHINPDSVISTPGKQL